MFVKIDHFGYLVHGELIGSTWLSLIESILEEGQLTIDEGRRRYSLQNVRIKCGTSSPNDPLIEKYANKENIAEILKLTFKDENMYDIDITPSFSPGSKSYYARIKDWQMIDFVVKRLTEIPESKKAIMSFIRNEDYQKVLENPKDDYLPCITTIQYRLLKIDNKKGYHMNIIFNARSIDAYQKSVGNLIAIAMLGKKISRKLESNLGVPVWLGSIDGMITDAHIYENTLNEAKELISSYKLIENGELYEKK
jgi:thymidylate synthase